jgi:hypothetical protein
MGTLVLVALIPPGQDEAWRRVCQELLGSRRPAYEESRRRLGVRRERSWLARTAWGDLAIICVEAGEGAAFAPEWLATSAAFEPWLRSGAAGPAGAQGLPAGRGELVFDWQAP